MNVLTYEHLLGQIKFVSQGTTVPRSTSMATVCSETSCDSMDTLAKKAAVLFWLTVVYHIASPLAYEEMGRDPWAAKTHTIILKLGYFPA